MSVQLIDSPTLGRVWVVDRWQESRKLLSWYPVFHRDEIAMLRVFSKPPVQTEALQMVADAKRVFGGGVVIDVWRRLRAYKPRQKSRYVGFIPEPRPEDLEDPE